MGILLGVFIAFLASGIGGFFIDKLRIPAEPDERCVLGTGLGLGLVAYLILSIGLGGVLNRNVLFFMFLFLMIGAVAGIRTRLGRSRGWMQEWSAGFTKLELAALPVAAIAILAAIAGVLAPETANDSLCYHLHLPKIYLAQQRISFIPFEVNAQFPFLMEMLFTLGLALKGMAAAKSFHFLTGLLAAGAMMAYARQKTTISNARWFALLFLTTPGILNEFGTAYVDVALACFSIFAIICYLRWNETESLGFVLLAGVFTGFALSVKFLALITALPLFLFISYDALTRRRGLQPIFVFPGAAFLFSFIRYLRSYLATGNPVFPYFYSVFKSGDPTIQYNDIGVPKNILSFLGVLWSMTMHPEKFEGFGAQIGPVYLAFLPLAFLGIKKHPVARRLGLFVLFYMACWFVLGQSPRFFFPVLPCLAILMAWGADWVDGAGAKISATAVRFLFFTILSLQTAFAVYHYRPSFRVALGLESEPIYLRRMERSYEPAQYINETLPADAKILVSDEAHLYYFNRTIIREHVYAEQTRYFEKAIDLKGIMKFLSNQGFTHILITGGMPGETLERLQPLRIPQLMRDHENQLAPDLQNLYTYTFRNPQGEKIHYTLYKINP